MEKKQKTVVILGMHRSGTSMTAGILRELGVFLGERLVPPDKSNPLGHFEDMDFLELNEEILKASGGSCVAVPKKASILAQREHFGERIERLIASRGGLWGWKDPRTCLTVELFLPYLRNPYFIVCRRGALSVARSLRERNNYTTRTGKRLKRIYDRQIKDFFRNHPGLRRMDLEYAEVLANPEAHIRRIMEFLGIREDEDKLRRALAVIRPKDQLLEIAEAMRQTAPADGE